MNTHPDRKIVEDIGTHYRLEGDDFWYHRVIGPGPDLPMYNIGPGRHPDPRRIGPLPTHMTELNETLIEKLCKELKKLIKPDSE